MPGSNRCVTVQRLEIRPETDDSVGDPSDLFTWVLAAEPSNSGSIWTFAPTCDQMPQPAKTLA